MLSLHILGHYNFLKFLLTLHLINHALDLTFSISFSVCVLLGGKCTFSVLSLLKSFVLSDIFSAIFLALRVLNEPFSGCVQRLQIALSSTLNVFCA